MMMMIIINDDDDNNDKEFVVVVVVIATLLTSLSQVASTMGMMFPSVTYLVNWTLSYSSSGTHTYNHEMDE